MDRVLQLVQSSINHPSMNIKLIAASACAAAVTSSAFAGPAPMESAKTIVPPVGLGFDAARRPITNPTKFDLAVPRTGIHAIYMHQNIPSNISFGGGEIPLGGDFNLYAVQFEYAFNERFSFVASKDGYIDFNPDNVLSNEEGWADLAAGLKYAFILDPVQQFALSGTFVIELPTGQTKVFQGNGDGGIDLSFAALKLLDKWQFAGAAGMYLPFDNGEEATTGFASAHVGYNITDSFYVLAELNWYTVLSTGDGSSQFSNSQLGTTVPGNINFEGGDLINFGADNAGRNRDIVTAAVGLRYKICDFADTGVAYELPLTDEENNLMDDRITVDLVFTF